MKTIKGLNEIKTIEGRVIFSKPISLVKAASVLHKFINEDTGDLDVISKYLKLASACFDEHVQFHKELKGRSRHKHKKIRMERVGSGALTDAETSHREEALPAAEQGQFVDSVEEQALKNRRKPEGGGFDDKGMNSQRKRKKDFSDFGLEARVREVLLFYLLRRNRFRAIYPGVILGEFVTMSKSALILSMRSSGRKQSGTTFNL
ncbi:hypothetical protein NE237_005472 [Protea cynaroides]|uniref:Uncharacterized protein n=1 Tax=Protea cynaroides TaxID=273540 RepID=A0A9Q0QUG9_9MAGN|nr:hypothetical protein NE237_005472 [Protea cynaroides]